jgi:L-alanine-DL-glutamate epimerase-like enolase superfamily enzyme
MHVQWRPVELHLRQTFRIARSSSDTRNTILVKLGTDASPGAMHGLGEIIPYPYYGQTREFALELLPLLSGVLGKATIPSSLSDVRKLCASLERDLIGTGHPVAHCLHVVAAVSGALCDLASKSRGISLSEFIAEDLLPEEKKALQLPFTSYTLGIDTPEKMREKVKDAEGFKIIKIKLGQDMEADKELVRVVKDASPATLRVDANCGWDLRTSIAMCNWLAELGVEFVEQPMKPDARADYQTLVRESPVPIVLDESILTQDDIDSHGDLCHGVCLKFSKCGGMIRCLDMMRAARRHGLKVMMGCMIETTVGIGAAYELSALVDWADLDGNLLVSDDPYAGRGNLGIIEGRINRLAERPGLGFSDETSSDWRAV